jgi:hypothetical protein
MIALGQAKIDNINRMITITSNFYLTIFNLVNGIFEK